MLHAYRDNLTDDVWTGKHYSIWPGTEESGLRYAAWRMEMQLLKQDFEVVLEELERTMARNTQEQKDISALQTQVSVTTIWSQLPRDQQFLLLD